MVVNWLKEYVMEKVETLRRLKCLEIIFVLQVQEVVDSGKLFFKIIKRFNVDNGDIIGPRPGNLEYGWLNDSKDNMRCENRNTQDLNLGCHILYYFNN